MKKELKTGSILLFSAFLLLACDKTPKDQGGATANQPVQGTVLATVGNSTITLEDFERKFNSLPPQYRGFFNGEEGKKRFMDQLVREKMLVEQAVKQGIDKNPDVQYALKEMRDEFIAKELYSSKTQELVRSTQISDQDLNAELKNNNIASATHILIKDEKKAKDVLAKVKKGEDIKKLAAEFSEDPSAKRNSGELGTFAKGEMVPEFDSAIFKLKIGETTQNLVQTKFGYHIIKRLEPNKEELKNNLSRKKQMELFEQWIEGLKKEFPVAIKEEVLKKASTGAAPEMQGMPGMPSGHPAMPASGEGHAAPHPAQ
ncbi:peptidylprolyl isomerase [Candidatus Poribacteria bacterium]|nr:peptidylprolyl isomerase [Candidatus Poribacteria bacterium]